MGSIIVHSLQCQGVSSNRAMEPTDDGGGREAGEKLRTRTYFAANPGRRGLDSVSIDFHVGLSPRKRVKRICLRACDPRSEKYESERGTPAKTPLLPHKARTLLPAWCDDFGMATSSKPKASRAKKSSKPISFRPEQEVYDLLERRAAKLGMGSIHELASHYVTGIVREDKAQEPSTVSMTQQLAELREDLWLSVEALLTSAGKVKESEARRWAEENLRT
jgi:hypothetical protein